MSYADDKVKQTLFQKSFMLMTKSNRHFFSNQGDVILRLMIKPVQVSNSTEISSMSTLSASFRKIWSKLYELWWWQAFSHCKSRGPCGCHSNQSFHWISIKKLISSMPHQRHAIYVKWLRSACRLRRYNWSRVWMDGQWPPVSSNSAQVTWKNT